MRTLILAVILGTAFLPQHADETVYKVGDPDVVMPVVTHRENPHYTGDAMRRKVQGTVRVTLVVNTDGTVRDDVQVTRSLDPDLDAEAVKAAKLWTFTPGMKDGKAVNVSVWIDMTFTLKE